MKGVLLRRVLSRLSLSLLCACACLAAGVSAQEVEAGPPRAKKIDEFGRLRGCDAGARADNFAIELQNDPSAKGYIIARDSRERLWGVALKYGEYLVHYFVNARGLDESRFVVLEDSRVEGDEFSIEFWLVPYGAEPPRVKPPETKGAPAFAGKYAEQSVYNDSTYDDEADGVDAAAFRFGFVYGGYRGLLAEQKDSRGYVVVYSPPGAAPGYWRRIGTRERLRLASGDVSADRITVVNGGALPAKEKPKGEQDGGDGWEDETFGRVEFWIVPQDGQPPVKHVEEEFRLAEATKVGANNFYYEDEDDDAGAWLVGNLLETMRADERSLACIVVFPGELTAEGGDEPKPADVFKLAEKWKAELLKKHGLASHRVVVMNGPQQGWSAGRIEVWAVPHGAALPDPFAEEEEETAEGEEEPADEGEGGEQQKPTTPPGRREE